MAVECLDANFELFQEENMDQCDVSRIILSQALEEADYPGSTTFIFYYIYQ